MVFDLVAAVLHIDIYINQLIQQYGILIYVILFLIIFIETGLVFFPFLPGDSLIFAAGAFAAIGSLDIALLFIVLAAAAILGDTVNYWIGHHVGKRGFHKKIMKHVKRDYLKDTEDFYTKHGKKTIIIARFVPFIRTLAPFVAGLGKMDYKSFLAYNIIGGLVWVVFFLTTGFYLGNLPIIKDNFGMFLIAIIVLSVFAGILELLIHKHHEKRDQKS